MGRITASRTQLKPDPKFDSILASKFINCLMWDGKKTTAQAVFYRSLDEIKKRVPDAEPIEVFTTAVENVKPHIEVRSKRVGGAAYQVPMQVNKNRQQSLAIPVTKVFGTPAIRSYERIEVKLHQPEVDFVDVPVDDINIRRR